MNKSKLLQVLHSQVGRFARRNCNAQDFTVDVVGCDLLAGLPGGFHHGSAIASASTVSNAVAIENLSHSCC